MLIIKKHIEEMMENCNKQKISDANIQKQLIQIIDFNGFNFYSKQVYTQIYSLIL